MEFIYAFGILLLKSRVFEGTLGFPMVFVFFIAKFQLQSARRGKGVVWIGVCSCSTVRKGREKAGSCSYRITTAGLRVAHGLQEPF